MKKPLAVFLLLMAFSSPVFAAHKHHHHGHHHHRHHG